MPQFFLPPWPLPPMFNKVQHWPTPSGLMFVFELQRRRYGSLRLEKSTSVRALCWASSLLWRALTSLLVEVSKVAIERAERSQPLLT